MHTKKKYPNCLRRHRKANGLSCKQVAKLLDVKSQAAITKWERGYVMPSSTNLFRLSFLYKADACLLYPEYYRQITDTLKEKIQKHHIRLETMTATVRSLKQ